MINFSLSFLQELQIFCTSEVPYIILDSLLIHLKWLLPFLYFCLFFVCFLFVHFYFCFFIAFLFFIYFSTFWFILFFTFLKLSFIYLHFFYFLFYLTFFIFNSFLLLFLSSYFFIVIENAKWIPSQCLNVHPVGIPWYDWFFVI